MDKERIFEFWQVFGDAETCRKFGITSENLFKILTDFI